MVQISIIYGVFAWLRCKARRSIYHTVNSNNVAVRIWNLSHFAWNYNSFYHPSRNWGCGLWIMALCSVQCCLGRIVCLQSIFSLRISTSLHGVMSQENGNFDSVLIVKMHLLMLYREIFSPYRAVNTLPLCYKTSQLMLYREIIAVCSQIHIKHITQITFKYPVRTAQ